MIRTIAGVDVSNAFGSNRLFAAVVVLDLQHPQPKGFPILEVATASLEVAFPYVPGLLSFREIPVVFYLPRSPDDPRPGGRDRPLLPTPLSFA